MVNSYPCEFIFIETKKRKSWGFYQSLFFLHSCCFLTLSAATPQNGQTHSNKCQTTNCLYVFDYFVWGWRLKGKKNCVFWIQGTAEPQTIIVCLFQITYKLRHPELTWYLNDHIHLSFIANQEQFLLVALASFLLTLNINDCLLVCWNAKFSQNYKNCGQDCESDLADKLGYSLW